MPWQQVEEEQDRFMQQSRRGVFLGAGILAALAGYINVVLLGFFAVPVSHMSGAVAHLGIDLANWLVDDLVLIIAIIVGFWLGALLSGLLIGTTTFRLNLPYAYTLTIQTVFLLIAAVSVLYSWAYAVTFAAFACGMQNAMAASFRGLILRTTHVTGIVTDLGALLGNRLRGRQVKGWKFGLLLAILGAFFCGGLLGALAVGLTPDFALFPAAVVCALVAAVSWRLCVISN